MHDSKPASFYFDLMFEWLEHIYSIWLYDRNSLQNICVLMSDIYLHDLIILTYDTHGKHSKIAHH